MLFLSQDSISKCICKNNLISISRFYFYIQNFLYYNIRIMVHTDINLLRDKKISLFYISTAIACFFMWAPSAFGAVQVVLPNGGECLTVGTAYIISTTFTADHVALYYRTDGQQPTHLDSSEIKHPLQFTTWSWTPSSSDISETGRIWIEGHANNHNSNGQWDQSNANFSVRTSCQVAAAVATGGGGRTQKTPAPLLEKAEVINIASDQATVLWTTDRVGYTQLEYGLTSGTYTFETKLNPVVSLQHLVKLEGLTANTTYYFRVINGSSLDEREKSIEYTFTTLSPPPPPDLTPPAPVSNIFGLAGASTTLLTWQNPPNEDFLEVVIVSRTDHFALTPEDGDIVFKSTEQYYRDAGLINGVPYYYSLFSFDKNNNASLPVRITITPDRLHPEAPSPPLLLEDALKSMTTLPRVSFLSSEPGVGHIMLRWKNPSDKNFLGVQIVRNLQALPANPFDGDVIFRGRADFFRDAGPLLPGRYFYGVFGFDWTNTFSTGAFITEVSIASSTPFAGLQSIDVFRKAFSQEKVLRFGVTNDAVRNLQLFLANDPTMYPEGLVTGYFGSQTRKAVQRFQSKYSVVSSGDEQTTGFGSFGLKTKKRALELLDEIEKFASTTPFIKAAPSQKIYFVYIQSTGFEPSVIRISAGDIVRWVNKSPSPSWPASDDHPTHTNYSLFDALRTISQDDSYSFVFSKRGVWGYHDHLHAIKVGKIIVE